MGKIGTWSYWFTKDDKNVTHCTNKLDIPKGSRYVKLFKFYKPDGNIDDELLAVDDELIWVKHNINKLNPCDKVNASIEELKEIYKVLNVKYPEKDYNKILKKKVNQNPKFKKCKIIK